MTLKHLIPFLLLATGLTQVQNVSAKGAAAGELIYEHISDSTYRFYFVLYQECANGTEPTTVPLCLSNKCNSITLSYNMPKWTGSTKYNSTTANCPNVKTNCDSVGATLPGYKSYWYSTTVTLPSRCNYWKIFSYVAGRNNHINNIDNPASSPFYVEATFDNTIAHNNSSPYFEQVPIVYTFQNTPYTFINKLIDNDGDSLFTELIHPLTGVNTCTDTPKSVTFKTQTPVISVPSNPIQTGNNNFLFNTQTGDATFTSTDSGRNSFAIRTSEYRNGKLIGSVTREVQIQTTVYMGGRVVPGLDVPIFTIGCNASFPNPTNQLYACPGKELSFCFYTKTYEKGARLIVTIDSVNSVKGTMINYSGQKTDSVYGNFKWTPPLNTKGLHYLHLLVTDSTCRIPQIIVIRGDNIPIYVLDDVKAIGDTTICPYETAILKAIEGDFFSWRALPGGDMNSINNSNFSIQKVNPAITTSYEVTSGAHNQCGKYKDTVTVTVRPLSTISTPSIRITVSPDSNVKKRHPVMFKANVSGCNTPTYQWLINGTKVINETNNIYTANYLLDSMIISCKMTCNDVCATTKDTISNAIRVSIKEEPEDSTKNVVSLSPNPNNGSFTIQITNLSKPKEQLFIELTNSMGQSVYSRLAYPQTTTFTRKIKLPNIAYGVYTLKLKTSYFVYTTQLLIME